jgi:hypothetical protein
VSSHCDSGLSPPSHCITQYGDKAQYVAQTCAVLQQTACRVPLHEVNNWTYIYGFNSVVCSVIIHSVCLSNKWPTKQCFYDEDANLCTKYVQWVIRKTVLTCICLRRRLFRVTLEISRTVISWCHSGDIDRYWYVCVTYAHVWPRVAEWVGE